MTLAEGSPEGAPTPEFQNEQSHSLLNGGEKRRGKAIETPAISPTRCSAPYFDADGYRTLTPHLPF
eukprot:696972-Pyramimonas_sp.AAC.1